MGDFQLLLTLVTNHRKGSFRPKSFSCFPLFFSPFFSGEEKQLDASPADPVETVTSLCAVEGIQATAGGAWERGRLRGGGQLGVPADPPAGWVFLLA